MKFDKYLLASFLLLCGVSFLLFEVSIHAFPSILCGYTLAFLGYFIWIKGTINWKTAIFLGWSLRAIAVFAFPGLSDDIYRFIWDGWLITEGINPFSALPISVELPLGDFQKMLLEKMNSPQYYSVYPTVLQGIFALTVSIIPSNIIVQSIILKFFLLIAEWITLTFSVKLLEFLSMRKELFLVYFLNPLVIVEGMGNLHMEILMISGLSVFLYYLGSGAQKLKMFGIVGFVLSIASKLLTILVMPFMIKRLTFKEFISFSMKVGVALCILFLPLFIFTYENFGKGLDLYFQKFEFNASFYYIFRSLGFYLKGYNIIAKLGPVLAISSAIGILIMALLEKDKSIISLCKNLTFALTLYFFLGTTVHPWYTTTLVFLTVFSGLRYPVLWSYLIIFSYAKYYADESWYYPMVALEYILLWIWILGSKTIYSRLSAFNRIS